MVQELALVIRDLISKEVTSQLVNRGIASKAWVKAEINKSAKAEERPESPRVGQIIYVWNGHRPNIIQTDIFIEFSRLLLASYPIICERASWQNWKPIPERDIK